MLHRRGLPLLEATVQACKVRLRPILMTSLATLLGMIPMALGLEAGSEQYAPLARAIIGGLAVSVVVTMFLVPAVYLSSTAGAQNRSTRGGKRMKQAMNRQSSPLQLPPRAPSISRSLRNGWDTMRHNSLHHPFPCSVYLRRAKTPQRPRGQPHRASRPAASSAHRQPGPRPAACPGKSCPARRPQAHPGRRRKDGAGPQPQHQRRPPAAARLHTGCPRGSLRRTAHGLGRPHRRRRS